MEPAVSFKPYEQTDDSLKDDSGTDTLYTDLDVSTPDEADDSASPNPEGNYVSSNSGDVAKREAVDKCETSATESEKHFEPEPIPALLQRNLTDPSHVTPVISEYPCPVMPSFPIPPSSYYPSYPMFYPGMMPAPHPAYLPTFLPRRLPALQEYRSPGDLATTAVQAKPLNGRTSPADSLSSGVSSSSSPSPTRSPPQASPQAPKTYSQTPGERTSYTPHQVRAMENVFSENRYPDYYVLEKMSAELGIPAKKIKVWFQNKRARSKSRYPDASINNMAAMMSSAPVYNFPVYNPMVSLPVPPQAPLLMAHYLYPTQFQPYMC